jgi:hypothetical protein
MTSHALEYASLYYAHTHVLNEAFENVGHVFSESEIVKPAMTPSNLCEIIVFAQPRTPSFCEAEG